MVEVMTEVLDELWTPPDDEWEDDWRELPANMVKSLAKRGVVLVRLPRHGVNSEDEAQWTAGTHVLTQGFTGDVVLDDRLGISVEDTASVGAALLAADSNFTKLSDIMSRPNKD